VTLSRHINPVALGRTADLAEARRLAEAALTEMTRVAGQ